jgi:multiple sugar transport system substrate-binding protein
LGMMINHPGEYAALVDRVKKATGADKPKADEVLANTVYGMLPSGPVRRAVVFGGSNAHIMADKNTGHAVDRKVANAFVSFICGPEWSIKNAWAWSNPGNLVAYKTNWMKERLQQVKYLEYCTAMMPYGIPFPVIPESTEIMNDIVPAAMQNALTGKMTAKQSADDAAERIKKLISLRKD